jgi:2-dehydropantoate 2-reductase
MKICIYGAGAIGGYLGAELASADLDVTLIARGPHLEAMKKNGLKLLIGDKEKVTHPRCTDDPSEAGPQDFVIVTLKAPSAVAIAGKMAPLLGPDTAVVTASNGIPWWYFYNLEGPLRDYKLKSIDPDGKQWDLIGPQRAIGCVVYPAAEISEPGVVRHISSNRFVLGEPGGEKTDRVQKLSETLIGAAFKAPIRPHIRDEIWMKLWGNLCFNPLSALTHATLDVVATDPGTRQLAREMMMEAQAIGEKLGVRFSVDIERRIDGAVAVGAHKTSMLQDLELGRSMEIDALVTVVQEMGELTEIPTPKTDIVLALIQQRARAAGLYD